MRHISLLLLLAATSVNATDTQPMRTLDYFQGSWRCEGVFPASGRTIASRMTYVADLQGAALVKHHDDTSPGARYHAIETWAYDARAGRFNAAIVDSFGGVRRFGSDGFRQDTLTWESAAEVAPAQRFAYTRLGPRRYRVDWQVARNGKDFVVGDTLTCTRDT
ncbi:hypothetical protein [Fulvimonas yonginensis]|uniref:DUF1579 domain-containing protein n=1 Tax=Fulvimonas yonginensis TaxID=1495200 RepID=A0ABU8JDT8_9GAMM